MSGSSRWSHLPPVERIARLERDLEGAELAFGAVGRFGVMLLEQTIGRLVAERALTAETEREIWRRVKEQMSMIEALNSKLASGANHAMPPYDRWFKAEPRPRSRR